MSEMGKNRAHGEAAHGSKEGHPDRWKHLAHYAHEAHIAAEGVEKGAHKLTHAVAHYEEIQAAAKLAKAHAQMAYDLRRMARGVEKLENVAKQGGNVGAEAAKRLVAARTAFATAKGHFEMERPAVRAAMELLKVYKESSRTAGAGGRASASIAASASRFSSALKGSRIGKMLLKTGRVVSSPAFVRGLVVVGAAVETVSAYVNSPASSQGGKVLNGALGGATGVLPMLSVPVAVANLLAPEGYTLSEHYRGTADYATAILTLDTKAMNEVHRRSIAGNYGKAMQAGAEAGEYWAEKGVVGGLTEFFEAVRWWVSQ